MFASPVFKQPNRCAIHTKVDFGVSRCYALRVGEIDVLVVSDGVPT